IEEPTRLRKRIALGEIAVFDPTVLTAGGDFGRAEQEARAHLEDVDAFRCAIDVHRARRGGIRPMPDGHADLAAGGGGAGGGASGSESGNGSGNGTPVPPPPLTDHIRPEPTDLRELGGMGGE